MEKSKDLNQFDIPLAKRTHLNNFNSILKKIIKIFSISFPSIFCRCIAINKKYNKGSLDNLNFQAQISHDHKILGHLPYAEIPHEKLIFY